MKKKNNLKSLDHFIEEQYGKIGTPKRDQPEKTYESFRLGFQLRQARLEKGLTPEQLAEKCGTNKGYISGIENNLNEVRISTLQKIVELGLGGHLELSINCDASKTEEKPPITGFGKSGDSVIHRHICG